MTQTFITHYSHNFSEIIIMWSYKTCITCCTSDHYKDINIKQDRYIYICLQCLLILFFTWLNWKIIIDNFTVIRKNQDSHPWRFFTECKFSITTLFVDGKFQTESFITCRTGTVFGFRYMYAVWIAPDICSTHYTFTEVHVEW